VERLASAFQYEKGQNNQNGASERERLEGHGDDVARVPIHQIRSLFFTHFFVFSSFV
jgi:hypothetical protein